MSTRPLSRSLDPLPEESVAGYLLRLSCRLRISPLHLARLTGCTSPGQMTIGRRVMFAADARQLARAARLTPAEAESLTAGSWTDRYAPAARSRIEPGLPVRFDGWLASTSIRYCPQCLAGDGSPVQQQYGGPWKKTWHLPVTFACTRHQRFLAENCPEDQGQHLLPATLIPLPAASGLHPLQCRVPLPNGRTGQAGRSCGKRLDQAGGTGLPSPDPGTLAAQERILALLSPEHPAAGAARAFTDLRLISVLVCVTWPLSEDLMAPALAAAVTDYVSAPTSGRNRTYDRQPRGILATAGILTAAASITNSADLESILDRYIRPAAWSSNTKLRWAQALHRHHAACSRALRKPALAITSRRIASTTRKGRGRRSSWPAILAAASEADS